MVKVIGQGNNDFNSDRLERAVQRVAMSNQAPAGQAEDFASLVVAKINHWLSDKTEVTSRELRLQTAAALADYDPETAYLYENEKNLF